MTRSARPTEDPGAPVGLGAPTVLDRWVYPDGSPVDEEDRGLLYDLPTLLSRRRLLAGIGAAAGVAALTACSAATGASSAAGSTTSAGGAAVGTTAGAAAGEVPTETAGPYPGDGSNGPNVLDDSGIVRQDIRSSIGASTTTAAGIPLTVALTVTDKATGAPKSGLAVYLWHCDRDGGYSMYSQGLSGENYLRGIQPTDATGTATFRTIYPGCYSGRWPHIHFEVYQSVANATAAGQVVKTSQIALPEQHSRLVYATDGYAASVRNLSQTSLATDSVFRDDRAAKQLATMTGSTTDGFTAALTIGV